MSILGGVDFVNAVGQSVEVSRESRKRISNVDPSSSRRMAIFAPFREWNSV